MLTLKTRILRTVWRPLRLYNQFRGRAGRTEFWLFSLAILCLVVATIMCLSLIGQATGLSTVAGGFLNGVGLVVCAVVLFSTLLPSLSAAVRRLHDSGRSGRYLLLMFIPGIGAFILAFLLTKAGESEANQYGPPPPRNPVFG